jgi:hypothetical protein
MGGSLRAASPTSYLERLLNVIVVDPSVGHPTSYDQEEGGGHGQLIDLLVDVVEGLFS